MMEKRDYYIQPPYAQERAKGQVQQDLIVDKWQMLRRQTNTHGNIGMILRFDRRKNQFLLLDDRRSGYRDYENILFFSQVISSALLLYRLVCLGFYPVFPRDPYKTLWTVNLKHRTTGKKISFCDSKAGSGLSSIYSEKDQMPPELQRDLMELLDFLVSNEIVHPYDLTIAGSVA